MFSRSFLLFALLLGVFACKPSDGNGEQLDQNALFDQKPVRTEGWKVEGQSSAKFDGLNLSTTPTSRTDALTQQEVTLSKVVVSKVFPALDTLKTGTARLKFYVAKKSKSGFKFDMSFATGVGLQTEVRVTEAGVTAKCGSLSVDDGIATQSVAQVITELQDHEIRIVRNDSAVSIFLDTKVIVANMACNPSQNPSDNARTAGWLKITLYSKQPSERINWTNSLYDQYETQLLLKRVTVYKDPVTSDNATTPTAKKTKT